MTSPSFICSYRFSGSWWWVCSILQLPGQLCLSRTWFEYSGFQAKFFTSSRTSQLPYDCRKVASFFLLKRYLPSQVGGWVQCCSGFCSVKRFSQVRGCWPLDQILLLSPDLGPARRSELPMQSCPYTQFWWSKRLRACFVKIQMNAWRKVKKKKKDKTIKMKENRSLCPLAHPHSPMSNLKLHAWLPQQENPFYFFYSSQSPTVLQHFKSFTVSTVRDLLTHCVKGK